MEFRVLGFSKFSARLLSYNEEDFDDSRLGDEDDVQAERVWRVWLFVPYLRAF